MEPQGQFFLIRSFQKKQKKRAEELGASVFTQKDIYIDVNVIDVTYCTEESDNPPPTLRIAREAMKWASMKDIEKIYIACAVPHWRRARRNCERAAEEKGLGIQFSPIFELFKYGDREWFCKDSTQPRTQSKRVWERRENILEILPFWIYKLVAS